jgi:hypothetical protein
VVTSTPHSTQYNIYSWNIDVKQRNNIPACDDDQGWTNSKRKVFFMMTIFLLWLLALAAVVLHSLLYSCIE